MCFDIKVYSGTLYTLMSKLSLSGHSQQRPPSLIWPQIFATATYNEVIYFSLLPKVTSLIYPQFLQIGWPYQIETTVYWYVLMLVTLN